MLFCSPGAAHRWLRTTFAHRAWLLDELAEAIVARPPIRVSMPDACTFGCAFEAAVHYDLSDVLPHVHELSAFPRTMARELARLGGYGPPPGEPHTPWPSWVRRGGAPVPRRRLHHLANAISLFRDVYYRVGNRTATASRAILAIPSLRDYMLDFAARQEPAFLAFMASYDEAIRPALRALGPITAAPVLPGGRVADLQAGRTLVEVKTGWLTHRNDQENLIDQLLAYGLLSQVAVQPASHVAVYLARYEMLRAYPFHELAQRCAGSRLDVLEAADTYLATFCSNGALDEPGGRDAGHGRSAGPRG
jgi:hypothetical protein